VSIGRAFVTGFLVALTGSLVTGVVLGYVGLSRGVAIGPVPTWLEHRIGLGVLVVLALAAGLLAGRVVHARSRRPLAAIVMGILVAYVVIGVTASVVVGEIEIGNLPDVVAVLSGLGLWPLGIVLGALLADRQGQSSQIRTS
jgi:hypothetical protein